MNIKNIYSNVIGKTSLFTKMVETHITDNTSQINK